ncbi:MAG: NAD(P)/FAD-dependent oxidoreductase [Fibromonadaceae bacterium]|jgi:protoporphyrinogen oxidase|nr:NAD(P)/FAD-dependent oxidoreductase [Fibromonadaceae bacterium]
MKTALIIGAGPAGLTAALELLEKGGIHPIVVEQESFVGGISRTVEHNGNRMDIGGHRFFSKNDWVMNWWKNIYGDMMLRPRLSRILYMRKFFDYPVSLNANTIKGLGIWRMMKIGISYLKACLFQIKNEKNLQDFMLNRFGKELYLTFFKDYTEKVWGIPCEQISAEWGAQRIKGLSIAKTIKHALFRNTKETSLIDEFLYPKLGPGDLWQCAADKILKMGGEIKFNTKIENLNLKEYDYVLSSMPIKDLINAIEDVPQNIKEIANGLVYRDFITVGVLLEKLEIGNIKDNWIYVQESDVKVGRLQIFNNWSEYLVKDKSKIWLGMEYFANEGDDLWNMSERVFSKFAISELEKIGIAKKENVLDTVVVRVPKAYPAYFGTYNKFGELKAWLDSIDNLFLIGRNGMHKYNNMDHSMLSAKEAVNAISSDSKDKSAIWSVNSEEDYHEGK